MTIAGIIGPVDIYSAAVATVMAAGGTVVVTTLIARYQTRRKTDQQFELERLKLHNADAESARINDVNREVRLGQIAATRQVDIARIEGGMIDLKSAQPAE